MAHGDRLDPREGGFGRRLLWAYQPVETGAPRGLGSDERPRHGPYSPVEGELPEGGVLGEPFGRYLMRGSENRERDRQVEAGALLAETRRGEVDGDPPEGPFELGACDPAAYSFFRFLACLVGEADDRKRRHSTLEVGFHLDRARLEADERMGGGACKHLLKLRRRSARRARTLFQWVDVVRAFRAIASQRDRRTEAEREIPKGIGRRTLDGPNRAS